MEKIKNLIRSNPFVLSLLVLLLVLSFIQVESGKQTALEKLLMTSGLGKLNRVADTHIENQQKKALNVFLGLSVVKTGLALIRSTEVNLGFGFRPGAVVNAVYDYVNIGWKVVFAATTYYYISAVFLSSVRAVDVTFLRFLLIVLLGTVACRWWLPAANMTGNLLKRISVFLFTAVLLLYVVVPLTFVGGNWISSRITDGPIDKAAAAIEVAQEDLQDRIPYFGSKEPDLGNVDGAKEPLNENDPTKMENDQSTQGSMADEEDADIGVFSNALSKMKGIFSDDPTGNSDMKTEEMEKDGDDNDQGWFSGVRETLNIGKKVASMKGTVAEFSEGVVTNVLKIIAAYIFNIIVFPILFVFGLYWFAKAIIFSPTTVQLFSGFISPLDKSKNFSARIPPNDEDGLEPME